jgi:FkbM family methyltransferase
MNRLETTVRRLKRVFGVTSASPAVAAIRPSYNLLLNVLYRRRGLVRVINGQETVRVRATHRYADENYELPVFNYLKRSVQPGAVVLEVGAHIGMFTVLLARWVGSSGQVYAFEPAPRPRAALEDHLSLNRVREWVQVVPAAVSDRSGQAHFFTCGFSPENTLSPKHTRLPKAEAAETPITTIDAFCSAHKLVPSLLKIDIEGFELHALRGATRTLTSYRPVVVVEFHPMNWPEIGVEPGQVSALLDALGYRVVCLDGQNDPLTEYGHVALEPA